MDTLISHIYAHLLAADLLALRDVLRVALLSGGFTGLALLAFRENATSRRMLVSAGILAVLLVPWLLAEIDWRWQLPMATEPDFTLAVMLPNLAVWLWLLLAVPLVADLTWRTVTHVRRLNCAPQIHDPAIAAVVEELSSTLGVKQPTLRWGPEACAHSWGQAGIFLPRHARHWPATTLRAVLAHELIHIQRRDDRWLYLCRGLCLVHWWLPWSQLMYRAFLKNIEESCDDLAADLLGDKAQYADALAGIAVAERGPRGSMVSALHAHPLVQRITRFARLQILQPDTTGLFWSLVLLLTLVGVLTSVQPVAVAEPLPASQQMQLKVLAPAELAGEINGLPYVPPLIPHIEDDLVMLGPERTLQRSGNAIYPGNALNDGVEGDVVVDFVVNRDGSVVRPVVVASSPRGTFDQVALNAVRDSRFTPAYNNDRCLPQSGDSACMMPPVRVQRWFRFRLRPLEL